MWIRPLHWRNNDFKSRITKAVFISRLPTSSCLLLFMFLHRWMSLSDRKSWIRVIMKLSTELMRTGPHYRSSIGFWYKIVSLHFFFKENNAKRFTVKNVPWQINIVEITLSSNTRFWTICQKIKHKQRIVGFWLLSQKKNKLKASGRVCWVFRKCKGGEMGNVCWVVNN